MRLNTCRAVVQILLTSGYIGYGIGSLDQDAEEIHMLVELLREEFGAQVRLSTSARSARRQLVCT